MSARAHGNGHAGGRRRDEECLCNVSTFVDRKYVSTAASRAVGEEARRSVPQGVVRDIPPAQMHRGNCVVHRGNCLVHR